MGGGKKKYKKREKYISKEKQLGKFIEEKKEKPSQEDYNKLLKIWEDSKK
jgi:hypothetical protein